MGLFWLSMGFYMGLGMDLLVSTFDVESVVFLKRGSHFLAFCRVGFMMDDEAL